MIQFFWHLYVYLMMSEILCGVFCGKLTKSCCLTKINQTGQPAKPGKYNKKRTKILTKRPTVATTFLSGAQRHHWGIGIPGCTFGSSIPARAIPTPSWGSAVPVATGSLWSLQWASPSLTLQNKWLNSLLMMVFWDNGRKGCLICSIHINNRRLTPIF